VIQQEIMKDVALDVNLFGPMRFDEITDITPEAYGRQKPSVNLIEATMFMPPAK
jgi:hypothetical protein